MHETDGRSPENIIYRSRYCNLGQCDEIIAYASNSRSGISGNVTIAKIVAAGENLLITEIGEVGWRRRFGGSIPVSAKDIDTKDGFCMDIRNATR